VTLIGCSTTPNVALQVLCSHEVGMSDPRRPEHVRSARRGADPTEQPRQPYPPYADPVYSGQSYYPPAYYPGASSGPLSGPTETSPTEKLPQFWLKGQTSPDQHTPEGTPGRPKPPRWLWVAATAAAVLLVVALAIALVIANGVAKKQTAVPLLPAMPSSQISAPTTSTSMSTSRTSSATTSQRTSTPSSPPSNASVLQTVIYNVTGEGRAISITYVGNDGMSQTEFNVRLPWSKTVSLPRSGNPKPNVTIVNIGHDVTCSVIVDGVQVHQHTGGGLTGCNGGS
jgi:MmpS family membrane protein